MITEPKLKEARDILAQVANGVTIVVAPQSISVGTPDNPAVCMKKAITVKWMQTQFGQPENRRHVHTEVDWDAVIASLAVDTIVLQEAVLDGTKAYKSAVIWHEYGHVQFGASENGNVYLYELQQLHANEADLGAGAVLKVVQDRLPSYRKAVDPNIVGLSGFLHATWQITL
jgi:hypothetical protein